MTSTIDRLKRILGSVEYSGPVPTSEISSAESNIGLYFPKSYRTFLELYGAAFVHGIEIIGIQWPPLSPTDFPYWSNIIKNTLMYRPDCAPENSIAISSDGGDLTYHLLCSTSDRDYEGVVIEWGPGANPEVPFANSFLHFIEEYESLYNAPNKSL